MQLCSHITFLFCVHFRELESLIFNSGMRLEELKDRMEQSEQNQPTLEPSPNRLPHAHQPFLNETEPQIEVL